MNHTLALNSFPIFKWRINLRVFWILSFVLITSLLVFYIFQINQIAKGTYLVKIYEEKINELLEENKTLEINSSQVNSLENLESLVKNLNFEKINKIYYIRILESQVVAK